jgi:DNA adenine methylase
MSNQSVRSPLRYPGGKQKSIPFLSKVIHAYQSTYSITEYREPFLGGGSVLLYAVSHRLGKTFWGNDANSLLMDFWKQVQADVDALCDKVEDFRIQMPYDGPKQKSPQWTQFRDQILNRLNNLPDDQLHNATRFFVLNRSTSSGVTESGGLTPLAYCERFTLSSIERLGKLKGQLGSNVKLTCSDYAPVLQHPGEDVFIFLDPPYLAAEGSRLYGKQGDLHKGFDHGALAAELKNCNHRWLMTIDNSPKIQELYGAWAWLYPWSKAYGMTNVNGSKSKIGAELLVANFDFLSAFQDNASLQADSTP